MAKTKIGFVEDSPKDKAKDKSAGIKEGSKKDIGFKPFTKTKK